ncbi:hypothetical protein V8E52_004326 [Russula decolorans]
MEEKTGEHLSEPPQRQVTIDMVPDLALIEIFDFYMAEALDYDPFRDNKEAWIILAHVCQKWRDVVFGSPFRLKVRLHFRAGKSVRVMLDTWPPLLIDIWGDGSELGVFNVGNIVAALEHNDRIHKIELWCSSKSYVEQAFAAMQKPFPSLTELAITFFDETATLVVPDLLLSGSAPLLRSLRLRSIQFPLPVLRNLLLSATDLVEIRIWRIPDSGLFSPEAVVACLSTLTRLEEFELGFRSPRYSGTRGPPSSTRCVLPALTSLRFNGPCQYLEHLIAQIDSPLLDNLDVIFFNHPVPDTPQLAQFVDRTPKLKALHEANIFFDGSDIFVSLPWTLRRGLHFRIKHILSNRLSVMVQLCTSSFLRALIPTMKHLYILDSGMSSSHRLDNAASGQWLDLLRPFTTVEDLYLSQQFSPHIVTALHGIIGEGMTEVLPSLHNIFLEKLSPPGPVEEAIEQFVAALHLSDHSITVSQWNRVRDPWWQHEDR